MTGRTKTETKQAQAPANNKRRRAKAATVVDVAPVGAASMAKHNSPWIQGAEKPASLTKNARLVELLTTGTGADIATLSKELGWQPHTTRAALTRLRQAGRHIETTTPLGGGARRYRIEAATPGPAR